MRSVPLKWTPLPEGLAAFFGYLAVGVVVLFPLVARLSTHILADDVFIEPGRSDAYNFLWTYWWIQKAALAGGNFYHCDWVLPPTGANLYFHTHVILPTLLTMPLGLLFGPVAGYNSMVVLMLSGAATVYYVFLRRTFNAQPLAGFIAGAFFGFSPYFVFKTHAHLNLVGGVFWAGALAVLVHAYTHQQFSWRQGVAFALLLWATFWTSFVEFFALLVVCATTAVVFIVAARFRSVRLDGWAQVRFLGMVVPGAISLLSLRYAPDVRAVDIAPFPDVQLSDLLIPARLSILGDSFKVSEFEYWGSHVPLLFAVLAVLGLRGRQVLMPVLLTAALIATLVLNPFGAPLALLRHLPFGTGFRVAGRFLPFFYFFALVPAAYGLERLLQWQRRVPRAAGLGALAILCWVELYPAKLTPSRVKDFNVPAQLAEDAARGIFTLIIPRGAYTNVLDTFQVSMNVPIVHLSYLAREDPRAAAIRKHRFPALYPSPTRLSKRLLSQMREAGVHYVLFEDGRSYDPKFKGTIVTEHGPAILVRFGSTAP